MLRPTLRRLAVASSRPSIQSNPYKAQKQWPPDFSKLHPKHQFRLERKYRRRSKLKWARPRWTKAVKLTAWGASGCQHLFEVLPSTSILTLVREWVQKQMGSIWTTNLPTPQSKPAVGTSEHQHGQRPRGAI
ncbi:hypothetical protein P7C71_g5804, partial [Lecanoromycetidae sp. Uapishka_2]